jgi:hypothetical protein
MTINQSSIKEIALPHLQARIEEYKRETGCYPESDFSR